MNNSGFRRSRTSDRIKPVEARPWNRRFMSPGSTSTANQRPSAYSVAAPKTASSNQAGTPVRIMKYTLCVLFSLRAQGAPNEDLGVEAARLVQDYRDHGTLPSDLCDTRSSRLEPAQEPVQPPKFLPLL